MADWCAAFTKHLGIAVELAKGWPVKRTSPKAAPVYDVIQFGMEAVVGDDTVRRFLAEVKKSDRNLSLALAYFQAETKAAHAFQVVIDLPF